MDSTIALFDEAYDEVEGLRRIDPEDLGAK